MLESLGIDRHAELVYRAMLAHPSEGVAALAARLQLTESEIRSSLDQLSVLALIQPSPDEHIGFRAIRPEMAMELLLARQHVDLAAQQMRVEASRAAAAQLIAECSALPTPSGDTDSEHLVGPNAIRERLGQIGRTIEQEVMTLAPGGAHPVADLEASRGPNAALLERGVRMRTIYLESIRNDKPTLDHVAWLNHRGGQVRVAPALPVRMIIMDRRHALLPVDTNDARIGAVLLRGQGTVAALCALFENIWDAATPLGVAPSRDIEGLPRQEAVVLRLLTQGLTDEAIAKRLGISPRTARRIAADLMTRLEARSRFEAGVHAVQDGWLPSTR